MKWYEFKDLVESSVGVPLDAFHAPFGLALYLLAAFAMRQYRRGPAWALLPVLVIQGVNEALDARDWWRWTGSVSWAEAGIDTVTTIALPILVAVFWMQRRRDH